MICCTKIHLLVMSISVTSARSSTKSLGHQLGTAPTREGGHGLGMEESAQPQRLQHAVTRSWSLFRKSGLACWGLLGHSGCLLTAGLNDRPWWGFRCTHLHWQLPNQVWLQRCWRILLCPCLAQDFNRSHQARDHIPTSHHLCHSHGHQRVMEVVLCQV